MSLPEPRPPEPAVFVRLGDRCLSPKNHEHNQYAQNYGAWIIRTTRSGIVEIGQSQCACAEQGKQ
jgi:hypothetical protein